MSTQTHIYGKMAQGRKELKRHLKGEKLWRSHAILAKCYDCMGGYVDGRIDCKVRDCPLYPYMPYKEKLHGRHEETGESKQKKGK